MRGLIAPAPVGHRKPRHLRRIGHSIGVLLPIEMVRALGWDDETTVLVTLRRDRVEITRRPGGGLPR